MAKFGRERLHDRELTLAMAIGLCYKMALERKNEWMDLPEFIRGKRSFSNYLEDLLTA